MISCPKCTGGLTAIDEDNHRYIENCYFCNGEGQISDEQHHQFLIDQVIGEIAAGAVEFSWGEAEEIYAAESGISSYQLKEDKVFSLGQKIADTINGLPAEVQTFLISQFLEV